MVKGQNYYREKIWAQQFQNAEMDNVGPASLDLRLGNTFLVPVKEQRVKLGDEVKYTRHEVEDDGVLWLAPGEFCLGTTKERIKLFCHEVGFIQGRSSIGRAGLTVENAGFVDPGFDGHITLELKNDTCYPIGLEPGFRVTQIVVMECNGGGEYKGKYNGQVEATGSRMHEDREVRR